MASLACGVGVAIGGGIALVLALPAYALKEILEDRMKKNVKRHLGRRTKCKVNFGDLDAPIQPGKGWMNKMQMARCQPPHYEDIFSEEVPKCPTPPPPYPALRG